MKLAFVGKGGSGKTTSAAVFARWLASSKLEVELYDGDINQHLLQALGYQGTPPAGLYASIDKIKEHLRGTNPRIKSTADMIKTTPPGAGSRLLAVGDPWLRRLMVNVNGVWAAAAGDLDESDLGVKCFHGKSGVIELLLGHTNDADDEFVLADLTAGADPFASSILAKVDAICLVVEPSLPSLSVYEQFKRHRTEWTAPLLVIGNKVTDAADAAWLKERIQGDLVGMLPVMSLVRQESRGEAGDISQLEPQAVAAFETLLQCLLATPRDWEAYRHRNNQLHCLTSESWANSGRDYDLAEQIDPTFRYPRE